MHVENKQQYYENCLLRIKSYRLLCLPLGKNMETVETPAEKNLMKKRGINWTSEEEILLIEEVLKFEDTLFGKMRGSGVKGKHGQMKESTWTSIAETLNS